MMEANEYERLLLQYGKAHADAAFNRDMRKEYVKIGLAGAFLVAVFLYLVADMLFFL